ncbi:MAG: sugar transferase [Paracoccaceae bacterium]
MIRCLHVLFSFVGLIIFLPLLTIIFVLALFCNGSPQFSQQRFGKYKQPFILMNFRTMDKNTVSVASHIIDAASITLFGHFLRRTRLDESPQLWNVFKGEMSLVRPRPGLPNQPELTVGREKLGIFEVRPGITGLEQVSGVDMSTPELLAETDARMIVEMSLTTYFKYIFLTVLGKGSGDRFKS